MNKNFFKKSFLYLLNSLISALLGILLIKICGLFINPSEYGIYNIVYGIYSLIVQIVFMVFSQSILRYYSEYNLKGKLKEFYKTYYIMYLLISIIYIILASIFLVIIWNLINNYTYKILITLFSVLFLIDGFSSITISFSRSKGLAKEETIASILNHLIKIIIFLAYFFIISKTVDSIVIGSICGMIIGIFFNRKALLNVRDSSIKFEKKIAFDCLKFGLPLIGVPIVNYMLSTSDQLIIKIFCGDYDAGLYSMGHNIANNLFSLITTFLIIAGHNIAMKKYDSESSESASKFVIKLSLVYFMICIPLLVEVMIFSEYLIRIFTSESYLDSTFVLSINSIGIVFAGYINYTNKPWEMKKKSWMIALFSLIGAVINIILNIVFVPIFGYKAAAVTTIISYFVVILSSRIGSRKILSLKIGFFKLLKVVAFSLTMGIFLYVMNDIFVDNIWKFIMIAFFGLVIYIILIILFMKKDIIDIINEFKNAN